MSQVMADPSIVLGVDVRAVREFIAAEFTGESPDDIGGNTPLITGGLLDSMALLKLIVFVEDHYGVTIAFREATAEHFDTLTTIAKLIQSKIDRAAKGDSRG